MSFSTLFFSTSFLWAFSGCGFFPERGDTDGDQQQAQWLTSARLVVDTDPTLTLIRLKSEPLDSTQGGHHVILARYDFNPDQSILGDEYSLHIALDLGNVRTVERGTAYALGPPPARIPAYATVSCLCSPLRPDSVRGTFMIVQRGFVAIIGRIDATLFFTEWNDSTKHASYRLRQRLDAVR
ncbi:MAG TPA: hypothetical protein VIW26_14470 [Gemmatimonadales bacterium]|jgi:hypothetical protein